MHETYLKMIDQRQTSWHDRAQFFALATRFMRRILVDHFRYHGYAKRGGNVVKVPLDELRDADASREPDLLALDTALLDLAKRDPTYAQIIELRYFGGMNRQEIATALGLSSATITRRYRLARAWLYRYLVQGEQDGL